MSGYVTKEELAKQALEFGVELDLTKKHADLVAEVEALREKGAAGDAEQEPEPEAAPATALYLRNRVTGQMVPYAKIFERNQDLEKVEVPIEQPAAE